MVSYKRILDEDEEHRARQRNKGICYGTVARRLYIRNTCLSLDDLIVPRKYRTNRSSIKQDFVPIGVICLNCGYTIGSPAAVLGRYQMSRTRKEFRKYLEETYDPGEAEFNINLHHDSKPKSLENLEIELSKIPRAQRRRAQREQEKLDNYREQLHLKETKMVK